MSIIKNLSQVLACTVVAATGLVVTSAPAQAHASLCIKSKPPIVEVSSATRLRGDAAIYCPLGGHETWISARVTIQKDYGSWWNRDWGQLNTPSVVDRAPDVGYVAGSVKRAGVVKLIRCIPGYYRTQVSYQVGGPAGTITTRMTSDPRKVDCRT